MSELPARIPWPLDFPDVIVHTSVQLRDAVPGYPLAKSGDADAALTLAIQLMNDEAVARIAELAMARDAILMPVVADETTGFNAIPDAFAQVLGRELALEVASGEMVQTNKVGHTRAPRFSGWSHQQNSTDRSKPGGPTSLSMITWDWAVRSPTCGVTLRRAARLSA